MNKDTDSLSGQDSLKLIEQMIGRARAEEKDSGKGWIIWGWLLFLASIIHYVLMRAGIRQGSLVWQLFGLAAFLLSMYEQVIRRYFFKTEVKVKTYTKELVSRLSIAFLISLFILVYGNIQTGIIMTGLNFGYLLVLYGFWMFIHASVYRYRLLFYGAFINWAGALLIFYFREKLGEEVLLVHATCVALGYLLPGYIALIKFGQSDSSQTGDKAKL